MKTLKGKAIYEAKGRANEFGKYAVSFYVGCSCNCSYCFNKKGRFAKVIGGDTPTLKKCFKDENHALEIFEKELKANLPELQKHGLFFSFTTDPMLCDETIFVTGKAVMNCIYYNIHVKILTKRADFFSYHNHFTDYIIPANPYENSRKDVAFGFTLTGHDELEPNASTNAERIEAMRKLHEAGFKTWASIEPIIDIYSSFKMICRTIEYCDLYKIGIESGKKYNRKRLIEFISAVTSINHSEPYPNGKFLKIYFKDNLLKAAGISRSKLPSNCVNRDYNIFNN